MKSKKAVGGVFIMFSNNLAIIWHLLGDFGKCLAAKEQKDDESAN
jgi:hypothetical protein